MFDLTSLQRADTALAETSGYASEKVIPPPGAVCPVTGQRGEMSETQQSKRAGVCPFAHGEHHG
ncbi:MAG: hypothetical protein AAFQ36_05575 [Pseudomonadota bacterium]